MSNDSGGLVNWLDSKEFRLIFISLEEWKFQQIQDVVLLLSWYKKVMTIIRN